MTDSEFKDPGYFFKRYRILWLSLVIFTFILLPLATLAFFGLLSWMSPAIGLFIYLATFGLHLTLFVGGRWSRAEGFSALKPKDKSHA